MHQGDGREIRPPPGRNLRRRRSVPARFAMTPKSASDTHAFKQASNVAAKTEVATAPRTRNSPRR